MSSGERTNWANDQYGSQWNNDIFLMDKKIEFMSFCEGHKQRLSTINWSY